MVCFTYFTRSSMLSFRRSSLEDTLDLGHVHHREELGEKEERSEEQSECEDIFTDVIHRRVEHCPARRQEVAVQ